MSFPVFLLLIFLFKSDLSKSEAETRNIIIPAPDKATFFLANKYRGINLDAVLGFRILQAHLRGALENWASKRELPSQQAQVESLVKKLSSLIEKASHSLGQSDPEYFKELPGFPVGFSRSHCSMSMPLTFPLPSSSMFDYVSHWGTRKQLLGSILASGCPDSMSFTITNTLLVPWAFLIYLTDQPKYVTCFLEQYREADFYMKSVREMFGSYICVDPSSLPGFSNGWKYKAKGYLLANQNQQVLVGRNSAPTKDNGINGKPDIGDPIYISGILKLSCIADVVFLTF